VKARDPQAAARRRQSSARPPGEVPVDERSDAVSGERDYDRLRSWIERFGRAWETRDPKQAAALFSDDGSYRETPFDKPVVGGDEIRAYWSTLPKAEKDISFG
jgi:hypothetical protein